MLASNSELARRLDELEARYEGRFRQVFAAIRELMEVRGVEITQQIGFRPPATEEGSGRRRPPQRRGLKAPK
jgi:hypothetical protein